MPYRKKDNSVMNRDRRQERLDEQYAGDAQRLAELESRLSELTDHLSLEYVDEPQQDTRRPGIYDHRQNDYR